MCCVLSHFSHVLLCAALRTVSFQAPLSMGSSKQESWSGLSCPPGNRPNPGTEPAAYVPAALQADSLPLSLLTLIFYFVKKHFFFSFMEMALIYRTVQV